MVKTPPYQKGASVDVLCPSLILIVPALAVEPSARDWISAQGAKVTQCSACSALTEEQWSHLRENFAKRSAYRQRTGSQGDSFEEPETEDPSQSGEDLSRVDDTLLDLELEDTGANQPIAGIIPLTSLPASLPAQNVPTTSLTMGAVNQPTASSSALFRAPHPMSQTVTQDILPPPGFLSHSTPGRQSVVDRIAAMSFPQPQRTVTTEIQQTPRTDTLRVSWSSKILK